MERAEQVAWLIDALLEEMPQYRKFARSFEVDDVSQRRLLRALMNLRPPLPLDTGFLEVQDSLLSAETIERGVVNVEDLAASIKDPCIVLWQGDITRLSADAIVNAANSALLGCFVPGHTCIDNVIHSAAGLQLRDECNRIMMAQGHDEPIGCAKITMGWNLPAAHVLHTVGPAVQGVPTEEEREALASCYRSCLGLAVDQGLSSVAFSCVSTGLFGFPRRDAARIAVAEVSAFLDREQTPLKVIFDVFDGRDHEIYRELLG